MADLIWEHINAHDMSIETCEEGITKFDALLKEYKDTVDLHSILKEYLATYPTPRGLTVYILCEPRHGNKFTREHMLAYFSNKKLDDTSQDFEDIVACMFDSDECVKDYVYQCYKHGYGFNQNRLTSLMTFNSCNNAIAEYIKYAYDNNILPCKARIFASYKNKNEIDIYTKMIGDRSVNYNIFKHFTNDFTIPVTEELRTKVLADLERMTEYPVHADFIVPTQKLADYIGFDYEKYKNKCYDNLNIQIARQLVIAEATEKTITADFVGSLIEKLNITDVKDLGYLLSYIMYTNSRDLGYQESFANMLKQKVSEDMTWKKIYSF